MKMHNLGIRGNVWKWISNFLSSRRAKCFLKGTYGPEFETFVEYQTQLSIEFWRVSNSAEHRILESIKLRDSIWRDGLLVKMHNLGIRGNVWKWISNFLSSRRAKCFLKGTYGPEFETFVGLPQGSVISPILFNIFLQDIYKNISCQKVKFADDGTIWTQGTDTKILSKTIEQELQKIFEWTLIWRMKLSPEKTEICLFSRGNHITDSSQVYVQLDGNDIKYNSNPKVLGLH